jgi:hypothetical protein
MKKSDLRVLTVLLLHIAVFLLIPNAVDIFKKISKAYPLITSFIKLGILATFGEMLALRIKTGSYNRAGFGVLPKALIWGIFGICVYFVFIIFSTGTVYVVNSLGIKISYDSLGSGLNLTKLFVSFCISVVMNIIFAPMLMTFHKITDTHITKHKGSIKSVFIPINMVEGFKSIDWNVMWHFVFKKTIPFFWIPAHTVTFILPAEFRVFFAAVLSIVLGIILAVAAQNSKPQEQIDL